VAASPATAVLGAALIAVSATAWLLVLRTGSSMSMAGSGASPSVAEGAAFTAQWGVMMAAMMLPSAAPMILLYRTVSRRLSADGDSSIPVALFAAVYLFLWLLFGVPVYGAYVALSSLAARWRPFDAAMPYAVAAVLVAGGVFQLTEAKRVCLRYCEAPLGFLMQRWHSGYAATLRLAVEHASYCIGCCWALMVILVAAGAMSISWVLAIAIVVFAEKVLPRGWRTARLVGVSLIALGLAVALHPELAGTMRPRAAPMGVDFRRPLSRSYPSAGVTERQSSTAWELARR
jgi:predicted metal-binding membrane protein